MIKTFTASTQEIDDVETAISELLEQLDLNGTNTLLPETIGIVSCFAEFIESGVWQALCEKLPFDVVGLSTIANTVGEICETMLTLLVITSDELRFSTAVSSQIEGEDAAPLRAMYESAASALSEKPSLMLTFSPLLNNFGSDYYVARMTEISGNVPNFGALAVDHNPDYHQSFVLMNGEYWRDRFAIILVQGPINPTFYIGTISKDSVFPDKGVVTAAAGNQLQMVNGKPTVEYLLSLGLTQNEDGSITGINSFPIIVDYNDGTPPVIRAMFALTPEGYAVCGGNIPVGATLSIGAFNTDEINVTTTRTIQETLNTGNHRAVLIYSCIGRYFAQGYDSEAEFRSLQALMNDRGIVYMAAYSGGELCPVYDKDGNTHNRNHNNTFTICAF